MLTAKLITIYSVATARNKGYPLLSAHIANKTASSKAPPVARRILIYFDEGNFTDEIISSAIMVTINAMRSALSALENTDDAIHFSDITTLAKKKAAMVVGNPMNDAPWSMVIVLNRASRNNPEHK